MSVSEYDLDAKYHQAIKPIKGEESLIVSTASNLSKEDNEKRLLRSALVKANGNRTNAAKLMGISRRTLHRKLVQWPELDV
jgi:transcriptional regulator of acetoin/glycerol metabolism